MKRIRVLIVDGSPVATDGLKSIIRTDPDIEVVGTAADGLEATAKAEQLKPSVILMDAQLPEIDGVEATRRIKERLPDIKILFLAVHTPYIDAALAAGADAFLMKDCGRREHLEAIRKLAEGGKKGS